jgi:Domain of unknown function (DUF4388)
MSDQYLSTSRLGNVLRLIALGRQTGLLRVVRHYGSVVEEGEIQFIDGVIRYASVGAHTTLEAAMTVLQNWGECSYLFLDNVNLLPPDQYPATGWQLTPSGSLPPVGSGSFPAGPLTSTPSHYPSQSFQPSQSYPPPYQSTPPYQSAPPYQSTPPYQSAPPYQSTPPYPQQAPNSGYMPGSGPMPAAPRPYGMPPQHILQRLNESNYIPRRITSDNAADAVGLDRRDRQLLLLVDGRRTIADLVRLTRRGDEEIRYILAYLISMGLVA